MCRAYRLPHSAWLAWDKDDRDKSVWQYVRDKQRCRSCGTRSAEWSPDQGGDLHAYLPVLDRCRGCEVLETERANHDSKGRALGAGAFVRLQPRG